MNFDLIILSLSMLWALYHTIKNKQLFGGLIVLGLSLGIVFAFLRIGNSAQTGVVIFLLAATTALVYALLWQKFRSAKQIVLVLLIFPILLYWLFKLNHLPGTEWLRFGLFIPFIAVSYGLIRHVNLKNEWGFIVILLAEAFTLFYPTLI
jgi:hypothetical protein